MNKFLPAVITLSLLALVSSAKEPPFQVTAENAAVKLLDTDDNGLSMFRVQFDLRLRNATDADVLLASRPVVSVGVDRRIGSGEWKTILLSSWYDTGQMKYEQCSAAPPGGTFFFPQVKAVVAMDKVDMPPDSKLVVRFHLETICKENGKQVTHVLVSDPIDLKLPQ